MRLVVVVVVVVVVAALGAAESVGSGTTALSSSEEGVEAPKSSQTKHITGLRSITLVDEPVSSLRFMPLSLRFVNRSTEATERFCGLMVDVRFAAAPPAPNAAPVMEVVEYGMGDGTTFKLPSLGLECYGGQRLSEVLVVGWGDESIFNGLLAAQLIHRSTLSHMAIIQARDLAVAHNTTACSHTLAIAQQHCNLVVGGQQFTHKGDATTWAHYGDQWSAGNTFVPSQLQGAVHRKWGVSEMVASARSASARVCVVADRIAAAGDPWMDTPTLQSSSPNSTVVFLDTGTALPSLSSPGLVSVPVPRAHAHHDRVVHRMRWALRSRQFVQQQSGRRLVTLRRLSELYYDPGNVRDMGVISGARRDIGERSQVMSCQQMLAMEGSELATAVSSTLSERLRAETQFPSFILKPLMTALLAPISQQIEKKVGPKIGPIIAMIYTMVLQIPLACHLVGYLCHKMGYHLANVLIEALTYKVTDYIITAVEGTLARDISSIMMTAVARWFSQTVVPDVTTKVANLIPAVLTPGLSAAVGNGVTMAITKPLTRSLKGPVLGFYYCQYCYTYSVFCDMCASEDVDAMERGWWLDI